MNITAVDIGLTAGAYLLGAVPFGYLIGRAKGVDVRTQGSGNLGATNVGRVLGKKYGIACFILDFLKGFLPALAVRMLHRDEPGAPPAAVMAGLAAIIGHNWPIYLKFRGGKGVATSSGVFAAIFPVGLAAALGVWLVVVAITRYVSLGSMLAGGVLFVAALAFQKDPFGPGLALTIMTALAAVLSVLRHRANIARLLRGEEHKIGKPRA